MKSNPVLWTLVCGTVLLVFVGCSGSGGEDRQATAKVHGKVTFNGEPLPTGRIHFVPTGGGPTASGEIGEDGTYRLSTYGNGDGAVVGSHKVMISAERDMSNVLPEDPEASQEPSLIPVKYNSEQSSGLTADVTEGGNEIDFDLTGK